MRQQATPYKPWTDDEIRAHAKRFKTRGAWMKGHPNTYSKSQNKSRAFHNRCCAHMTYSDYFNNPPPKRWGYWTKERVIKEGKRFKTLGEWKAKSTSSYLTAYRKRWHLEVFPTKVTTGPRRGEAYWTLQRLTMHLKRSVQITSVAVWRSTHPVSYRVAKKRRLIRALSKGFT